MEYQPSLIEEMHKKQETCSMIQEICQKVYQGEAPGFEIREDGILRLHGRICVPQDQELRQKILLEAHSTLYSIHPGASKMYKDLKQHYWCEGLKLDVSRTMSDLPTSQD